MHRISIVLIVTIITCRSVERSGRSDSFKLASIFMISDKKT